MDAEVQRGFAAAVTAPMVASSVAATAPDTQTATVDLGELGKVEIDGDKATLTVDGQEVEVSVPAEE